jgi:hypothetical protein
VSRADRLVPEGWTPRRGYVVAFTETADGVTPLGRWFVIDRAPDAGHWWVKPSDDVSRAWLAEHPAHRLQGCLALSGARGAPAVRMVPAGVLTLPGMP